MVGGRPVPAGLPPSPVGPLHPSWSPPPHWVPPTCTCPPDPVPPGCSSPGASQHLLILSSMNPPLGPLAVTPPPRPGAFTAAPGNSPPLSLPSQTWAPGGPGLQGCGQPLAGAACPLSAHNAARCCLINVQIA